MPKPRKPISPRRLAANRANAAKSTGPRTPEGKARSAQNSCKHGFTASTFAVVRLEELDEIARLKADLVSVYQPANSQELFALERMALAQQTLLRAARLEAGLFTTCLNEGLDPLDPGAKPLFQLLPDISNDIRIVQAQNRNYILAEGFNILVKRCNGWQLFLRYQAQAERNYRRALEEFERLKALRPELPPALPPELPNSEIPSEPTSDPQPEQNRPPSAPAPTNPNPPATPPFAPASQVQASGIHDSREANQPAGVWKPINPPVAKEVAADDRR